VDEKVRQALCELVSRKDPSVFQDLTKFETALETSCGKRPIEITALSGALQEKIPWELRKSNQENVIESTITNLMNQLQRNLGFTPDAAKWAIESWAIALGVRKSKPVPPAQTPQTVACQAVQIKRGVGIEYLLDGRGIVKVVRVWAHEDANGTPPVNPALAQSIVRAVPKLDSIAYAPRTSVRTQPRSPVSPPSTTVHDAKNKPIKAASQPQTHQTSTDLTPKRPTTPISPQPRILGPVKTTIEPTRKNTAPVVEFPSDVEEQNRLGMAYLKGTGVPINYAEAAKLFETAAAKGFPPAQYNLGNLYFRGQGKKENLPEAEKWFRKSAREGYAEAQIQLGIMYQCGYGVPLDLKEAQKWFHLAAEQGNTEAKDHLAKLLNEQS